MYKQVKTKNTENKPSNEDIKQESQITQVDTYIGELQDGSKINTNAKMNEPKELGNLKLDNRRKTEYRLSELQKDLEKLRHYIRENLNL